MIEHQTELLLDESLRDDGSPRQMYLALASTDKGRDEPYIRVLDDGAELGLVSVGTLQRIMDRYGRALDARIDSQTGGPESRLALNAGRSLGRLQFRAAVDAASRDYVVWREPGREPLAALGRQIATALRYLFEHARERR